MCACHVFYLKLDALVVLGAQLGVAALARVVVSGDSQGVCGLGQFRQYFFECPPLFGVQCFFGVECERAFGACARRGHDECADVQCALCVLVLLDGQAVLGGGGFDQQRALRRVAGVAQQSCNLRFCAASSSIAGAVACVGAAFVRDARAVLRMRVAFFLRERTKGLRDVFRCHFLAERFAISLPNTLCTPLRGVSPRSGPPRKRCQSPSFARQLCVVPSLLSTRLPITPSSVLTSCAARASALVASAASLCASASRAFVSSARSSRSTSGAPLPLASESSPACRGASARAASKTAACLAADVPLQPGAPSLPQRQALLPPACRRSRRACRCLVVPLADASPGGSPGLGPRRCANAAATAASTHKMLAASPFSSTERVLPRTAPRSPLLSHLRPLCDVGEACAHACPARCCPPVDRHDTGARLPLRVAARLFRAQARRERRMLPRSHTEVSNKRRQH
ncbi:hypothetical protein ERJ75_000906000 [Trypanosoma vivax]|nr:hypothetical protein ERJ75_000906000 [Trypanosoma vivax]